MLWIARSRISSRCFLRPPHIKWLCLPRDRDDPRFCRWLHGRTDICHMSSGMSIPWFIALGDSWGIPATGPRSKVRKLLHARLRQASDTAAFPFIGERGLAIPKAPKFHTWLKVIPLLNQSVITTSHKKFAVPHFVPPLNQNW